MLIVHQLYVALLRVTIKTPLLSNDKNTRITKSTVGFRTKKVFNFVLFYKTYLSYFFWIKK